MNKEKGPSHLLSRREFGKSLLALGGITLLDSALINLIINSLKGPTLTTSETINTIGTQALQRFFAFTQDNETLSLAKSHFMGFRNFHNDETYYQPIASIQNTQSGKYEVITPNIQPGDMTSATIKSYNSFNNAVEGAKHSFGKLQVLHQKMDYAYIHTIFGKQFVSRLLSLQGWGDAVNSCHQFAKDIYSSFPNLPPVSNLINLQDTTQIHLQYDNSYPESDIRARQLRIKIYFDITTTNGNLTLGLVGHGEEVFALVGNSPGTHLLPGALLQDSSSLEDDSRYKLDLLFSSIAGYTINYFNQIDGVGRLQEYA